MAVVVHFAGDTLAEVRANAAQAGFALEHDQVPVFAQFGFPLTAAERALIAAYEDGTVLEGSAKNISFSPAGGLKGANLAPSEQALLAAMMERFGAFAEALVLAIAPGYQAGLERGRTSFRPVDVAGRTSSWRKDDKRLHVDAFPSTPVQGRRLLRVFANVDQGGRPRRWRVSGDFAGQAAKFLPRLRRFRVPGAAGFMALTGLTKSRRTRYDELMLGLHDEAKRDLGWQASVPSETVDFLPGQVWVVFSDQVFHAALAGRNMLEQTFYLAPSALMAPETSPLSVLSRLTGQAERRLLA
jgi:hypothetical protein